MLALRAYPCDSLDVRFDKVECLNNQTLFGSQYDLLKSRDDSVEIK